MQPKVSVIIPVYNAELFIAETIGSVLAQTYTNIEIVVVDNGSTDNTALWFKENVNTKIKYYYTQNKGASAARNFGLTKATGEYIQFLDADDILHPDKIKLQIDAMQQSGALMSFSLWDNFAETLPKERPFKFKHIDYKSLKNGVSILTSFGMENWFIPVFSYLTHVDLIFKTGGWNETLTNNDDAEFFARVLYHCQQLVCVDKTLGYYRTMEKDSLSKGNTKSKIDSAYRSCLLIEEFFKLQGAKNILQSYPKRLHYYHYKWFKNDFPFESKRSAKRFDSIKAGCFLKKNKRLWLFIKIFGIEKGEFVNYLYMRILKRLSI